MPVFIRQSPSRPSASKSAIAPEPLSCEPAGSSIVTSIEPPWLRGDHERNFGALTSSCAARVLDAGLLGGADVLLVGRVRWTHLHDGGGDVAGGDPDVAGDDVDRGGDRFAGIEGRH